MNESPHFEQLRRHLEKYLGESSAKTWRDKSTDIFVDKYLDVTEEEIVAFVTFGLSFHLLKQTKSNTDIRQELLCCVGDEYADWPIENMLFSVAQLVLDKHVALKRGQVLGPSGPLFSGIKDCKCTAVYCTTPVFFPDDFFEIKVEEPSTIFVDLIPITTSEASIVRDQGWRKFEEQMDSGEIDVMNLLRPE